jgi:hypothetical protein
MAAAIRENDITSPQRAVLNRYSPSRYNPRGLQSVDGAKVANK